MATWKHNLLAGFVAGIVAAQLVETIVAKEARPPQWSRDVLDTFFDDAHEKLVGLRPDYGATAEPERSAPASVLRPGEGNASVLWSKRISADAIETEVKRLSQSVASSVTSPSAFKGGGYKVARRDFSELAVLLGVTAQYAGDVRWKSSAAGLRELFAQAAADAKVGGDASYREATARKQDLTDLIRGGRPQLPKADANVADWSKVAARSSLMQRINIAHQERLSEWLADAATFRRKRSDVAHEAQIVALLADVIHQKSFEYWDDETFADYAGELRDAATDLSAAAAADNFEQARAAIGRATKACTNCHDGYRG